MNLTPLRVQESALTSPEAPACLGVTLNGGQAAQERNIQRKHLINPRTKSDSTLTR